MRGPCKTGGKTNGQPWQRIAPVLGLALVTCGLAAAPAAASETTAGDGLDALYRDLHALSLIHI